MRPQRLIAVIGIGVLAAMVGLFAARPWVLDRLELSLLDQRFRLRGPAPTTGRVVLVTIDEKSIDEVGRWPWRRSVMARLIDRLTEEGVTAIGFDVVFSEPEIPPELKTLSELHRAVQERPGEDSGVLSLLDRAIEAADTDQLLAKSIARSKRTVLGYFFRTQVGGGAMEPQALERALHLVRKSRVSVARVPPEGTAPILTCSGVEPNLEAFQEGARGMGFFSTLRDRDGVVRRVPLIATCAEKLHVSLPLALLEILEGKRAMVLGDPTGIREIRIGNRSLPTDEGGKLLVNFRGPPGTFPHFPAADVLAGRVAPGALAGTVAIVGATEVGIGDVVTTPFGTVFPGVEIHANVLDNLLSGAVLRRHDGLIAAELAAVLLVGLLVVFAVPRLRSVGRGAVFATALLLLLLGAVFALFVSDGIWINATYPSVTLITVYLAVAVTQAITVEARARTIRRQYATYVPPEVVDEMIEHPDRFRLGTERRDLSILFSDIRGFTTIAEDIGPDDVSRLLNEYLTPVTQTVFASRGTLDKYIGDAVVAFWGAPLPVEGHPEHACEAALSMQEIVEQLRTARPDLPAADRLRIGIGIHSGEVVVGNMGSDLRFQYTVSGDGVNLCARLEGLTKFYRVGVLASSDLVGRLSDGFITRELDTVRVKGKRKSVCLYEIVGRRGDGDSAHLECYAEGLRAYREGRWEQAERALREVIAMRAGTDGPSSLLLERLSVLKAGAPSDWDGTWVFEEK